MPVTIGLLAIQTCLMAVLNKLGVAYDYDSLTLFFILLMTTAMVMESPGVVKDKNMFMFFLLGLFLRLGLLFCDYYVMRIMHSGADTERFFWVASEAAQNGTSDSLNIYYRWLAYLFVLVGPAKLYAQYVNVFCGIFSCVIMLKAFRILKLNIKAQTVGFALLCLLPNWVDLSAILLRESLIGFFVSLSLFGFVYWYQRRKTRYVFIAALAALPAVDLHGGMVCIPIAVMVAFVLYNAKRRKVRVNVISLCFLGLLFMAAAFLIVRYGVSYINLGLDSIVRISQYAVTSDIAARSAYLSNLSSTTWMDVIFHTPIRLFYFLLSPLPMDFRGVSDLIAFVFTAVPILVIICYAVYALVTCVKNRKLLLFFLLTFAFSGIVYAWGTFAAGTAMRHRDNFVPLYVLIFAVAMDAGAHIKVYKFLPFAAANILDCGGLS